MVPNSKRSWSEDSRRIFDADRVLLLNSYWYDCENGHESLSGMAKLDHKASHYFNFLLTREVGFTIKLMQEVVVHVVGGESILDIGHRLADRYTFRLRNLENQCGTARHRVLDPWVPTPGYTDWFYIYRYIYRYRWFLKGCMDRETHSRAW